jgi:hypothetical protein
MKLLISGEHERPKGIHRIFFWEWNPDSLSGLIISFQPGFMTFHSLNSLF